MYARAAVTASCGHGQQLSSSICATHSPRMHSSKLRHLTRPCGQALHQSRLTGITSAKPRKVSAEELEVELADRTVPLVVDFYASWCGPCVLLAKELEQVADELGDTVKVLKIDTDENPELSSQLQIQGLPTMVFIGTDTSKPALRTEGLLPAATIKDIVAKELA